MTTAIEINNMDEIFTFDITETTTASDVVDIVNDRWPGCARLLPDDKPEFDPNREIRTQRRKQRNIDRIAWKAEAEQRRAKGVHFK